MLKKLFKFVSLTKPKGRSSIIYILGRSIYLKRFGLFKTKEIGVKCKISEELRYKVAINEQTKN